eukprot:366551-Chlamydomonas_euryale.AAC.33
MVVVVGVGRVVWVSLMTVAVVVGVESVVGVSLMTVAVVYRHERSHFSKLFNSNSRIASCASILCTTQFCFCGCAAPAAASVPHIARFWLSGCVAPVAASWRACAVEATAFCRPLAFKSCYNYSNRLFLQCWTRDLKPLIWRAHSFWHAGGGLCQQLPGAYQHGVLPYDGGRCALDERKQAA